MIHREYARARHHVRVQEAAREYRSLYAAGGSALKEAEARLNMAVEDALAPSGAPSEGRK